MGARIFRERLRDCTHSGAEFMALEQNLGFDDLTEDSSSCPF